MKYNLDFSEVLVLGVLASVGQLDLRRNVPVLLYPFSRASGSLPVFILMLKIAILRKMKKHSDVQF